MISFNNIKKNLKDMSNDDKRIVGSMSNQITKDIEEKLNDKYQIFYQKELIKFSGFFVLYEFTHIF